MAENEPRPAEDDDGPIDMDALGSADRTPAEHRLQERWVRLHASSFSHLERLPLPELVGLLDLGLPSPFGEVVETLLAWRVAEEGCLPDDPESNREGLVIGDRIFWVDRELRLRRLALKRPPTDPSKTQSDDVP